ncbi:MAG: acetyl-CoA carboxylase biotin carboxylase subunit [Bdellovibrionales bacterium]
MFKKILVANRGEIALRVNRAAREMGVDTVCVYSAADRTSLHVLLADEAYEIGPAPSTESYLKIDKLIEVAKKAGAEAIHPGYGFLSESSAFVKAVTEAGLKFIGATQDNIEKMGDKLAARELMKNVDVPIVPGSDGEVKTVADAKKWAKTIGYPLMIKASAGGGGKGIRVVTKDEELESGFNAAQSEGRNYFGNDTVFMERFIQNPKHIEIQVFGDSHGNAVHLFERECSIQRRHQKIIEEAPSVSVPAEVREKMGEVAVRAAKSIKYEGAGTIEFIFDNTTKEFFFMEMNTRLQVEHPVTESITGIDLVKEQIKVAYGEPLSFKQEDIVAKGHSIELRINAEDPATFLPSAGKIIRCRTPQGPFIRFDGYMYAGYEVPIHYDPMLAKLIVWGEDRKSCIARLKRALAEFSVTGIKTNTVLHKNIIDHPKFLDGSYTTQFVDKELITTDKKTFFKYVNDEVFLIGAALSAYQENKNKNVENTSSMGRWRQTIRQEVLKR